MRNCKLSGRTLFLMPIHHGLVLLDEKAYPREVVGMEINKMKNEKDNNLFRVYFSFTKFRYNRCKK
jgi:hypothetical protein